MVSAVSVSVNESKSDDVNSKNAYLSKFLEPIDCSASNFNRLLQHPDLLEVVPSNEPMSKATCEVLDSLVAQIDHHIFKHTTPLVLGERPVVVLSGINMGDVSDTPLSEDAVYYKDQVSEGVAYSIASLLGVSVGYEETLGNHLIRDVYPTADKKDHMLASSSSTTLDFHVENLAHSHPPHFLVLAGLRQDHLKAAKTLLCSVEDIVRHIRTMPDGERILEVLKEKRFSLQVEHTLNLDDNWDRLPKPISVLSETSHGYAITYDYVFMHAWDAQDADAARALDVLREGLDICSGYVKIEPGMVLVFDNRRVLHGRSIFKARLDGKDRWLQRSLVFNPKLPTPSPFEEFNNLPFNFLGEGKEHRVMATETTKWRELIGKGRVIKAA